MLNKKPQKYFVLLSYFLLSLIGGLIVFHAMNWGPWAYSDSSAYVSAAKNILSGKGFSIIHSSGEVSAVTEFPPFYPIFLSMFFRSNAGFLGCIQISNVLLFIFSIFIFSQILITTTEDHLFSLIGTLLFLSFPLIISTFSSAMSEPLFLFLLLLSIYAYQVYITKKKRIDLILLIFISSLLPITRYAGILFVGVFGFCLFFSLNHLSLSKKIVTISVYFLSTYVPIGIWGYYLINKFNQFGGKNFNFSFSSGLIESFKKQFDVLKLWVPYLEIYQNTLTENLILFFSICVIVILFLFTLLTFKKEKSLILINMKNMFWVIFSSIIGYFLFIGLSYSITIPQIDIIDRMMIPIYPLFIILIIISLKSLLTSKSQNILKYTATLIICLIIIRFNILISTANLKEMNENGLGFTARVYQKSGIIKAIKDLPPFQILFSNSAGFVLFYDNRYPIQINNFPNHTFGEGSSYGEKKFREEDAALILFFSDFSNYYNDQSGSFLNEITKTLTIEYIDSEGGIYTYPKFD